MGMHRGPVVFYLDVLSVMVEKERRISPESLLKGFFVIRCKCYLATGRKEAAKTSPGSTGQSVMHKSYSKPETCYGLNYTLNELLISNH